MPIYEYRCSSCGHELEALRKFSDAPLLECPACHAEALVKKVSVAGFQLKGSGWYATDFRNGSKPAATPKSDDKAGGSDSASDAKGDATTAGKGDAATGSKGDAAPAADKAAKPAAAKAESAPAKSPATPAAGSSTS